MSEKQIATELCIAAAGNHVAKLRLWHAAGVDMASRDTQGTTCLHVAIHHKHNGRFGQLPRINIDTAYADTIEFLQSIGVRDDLPDSVGRTARSLLLD